METSNLNLNQDNFRKKKFSEKLKSFLNYLSGSNNSARYIRLEGDLIAFVEELKAKKGFPGIDKWETQALTLAGMAKEKLRKRNIDEGWKLLHAAKRMEAYGDTDTSKVIAMELCNEATKLDEWRKNSIHKIFKVDSNGEINNLTPADLNYAMKIRDEYYHKLYYMNSLARNQFRLLFVLLFAWIAALFIYIGCCGANLTSGNKMELMNIANLAGVLIFGLLGSTTSSIFHFRNSQSSSLVPEIVSNASVTLSRIFVGAGFSIFIFILLNTSFIKSIDIFSFSLTSCYEFFTIAFASGFSERLALNSIQKIIGKKE